MQKIARLFLGGMMILAMSACGTQDESYKLTNESRLMESFREESPALRQQVAQIVEKAKAENYHDALNQLALLSASHKITKAQKNAIELIVRQWRYDMEEKMFSEQDRAKDVKE